MIMPQYGNITTAGWCWHSRYGNIITTSRVSADACNKKHIKKLLKNGYSMEEIKRHFVCA